MKIDQYISQLLYRHQCVTFPGFGAFLTGLRPAQLHEATNSFYPPKKMVSFNPHLKNNDGLLANHISQAEKTGYDTAVASIESEVLIWKSILEVNGKFAVKNVGELVLNPEKNLVFTPSENVNYLTASFGLNSFVSPAVKREEYREIAEVIEEKAPVAFVPEKRASKSYLKYAAVFVMTLAAAGTIGFKLYKDHVAKETLVVEESVQKQVQGKIQEATFMIENPMPSVTLTVREDKLNYHIVAGVFRDAANAQQAYHDLTVAGYNRTSTAISRCCTEAMKPAPKHRLRCATSISRPTKMPGYW